MHAAEHMKQPRAAAAIHAPRPIHPLLLPWRRRRRAIPNFKLPLSLNMDSERKLCVMSLYLLHESASGLALFEHVQSDAVGSLLQQAQDSVLDLSRFSRIVKMKAFLPFKSAENALSVINDVSEGILQLRISRTFWRRICPRSRKGARMPAFTSE